MVNNSVNKNPHPTCFQCGSELIFVSKEIVQPEGTRYAQTNIVYRCSNEECQKKKDKEKADRLKQQQKRADNEKERMEKIQERKKLILDSKTEEN